MNFASRQGLFQCIIGGHSEGSQPHHLVLFDMVEPGRSLSVRHACVAGDDVARDTMVFHYYALACFVISASIVLSLKVKLAANNSFLSTFRIRLVISSLCFILGFRFLVLTHIDLVQMRLGLFACRTYTGSIVCMLLVQSCFLHFTFSLMLHCLHLLLVILGSSLLGEERLNYTTLTLTLMLVNY